MEYYNNYTSSIRSYEIHEGLSSIALVFKGGGEVFVYKLERLGVEHMQKMERLAKNNTGLNKYLNKNKDVGMGYSSMYKNIDEYNKLYKLSIH